MFKHMLVPTDGSPLAMKAVKAAAKLATSLDARITALYVMPPFVAPVAYEAVAFQAAYTPEEYDKAIRKSAKAILAKAAVAGGARCDTLMLTHANPWQAIIDAAKAKKCDAIVMASHGRRGLAGLLLGSETQKVLTHSKLPVLVCR